VVVVDASAVAAVVFQEPEAPSLLASLRDDDWCAPAILHYELTNIARTKSRSRPMDAPVFRRALVLGLSYSIRIETVDFDAVFGIASATGLSAYDASYLWLSRHFGVRLVTLDKKLAAHAEKI
jgi:predicted nucleic acid-binding protein